MLKLITGLIAGIVLTLGALFLALPTDVLRPAYSYVTQGQTWLQQGSLSNAGYNYRLGDEGTTGDETGTPYGKSQHQYLELVANQPLMKFSNADLKKVCLNAITAGTLKSPPVAEGYVFLTPDARRRLGAMLLEHPGTLVSFRFLGNEINSFIVDPAKVKRFIADADTYPDFGGNKLYDADLSFNIPDGTMDIGTITMAMLAGEKPLAPCDPRNSMNDLPGMKDGTSLYLHYLKQREELLKKGLTVFGTKKAAPAPAAPEAPISEAPAMSAENREKLKKAARYGLPWTGESRAIPLDPNHRFDVDDPENAPNPADTVPLIALRAAPTLTTLNRKDIQRVCLSKIPAGDVMPAIFDVNIWFTPAARTRVADALKGHAGELGSFAMQKRGISFFTVDKAKAEAFPSRDNIDLLPDISYLGNETTGVEALSMAFKLAGNSHLEGCTPRDGKPEDIPGYALARKYWEAYVKGYPDIVRQMKETEKR